jgi:hypothetical protein
LQFSTGLVAVQNAVPERDVGIATACVAFSRSLGAAIGVAVLTTILLAALRDQAPAAAVAFPGVEIMRDLMAGGLENMNGQDRVAMDAAVLSAFRKVLTIGAAAASLAIALAAHLPDDLLRDRSEAPDRAG